MIALDKLVGWVVGDLEAEALDEVEEHLFACEACTQTARWLLALRDRVAELAREGRVRHAMTSSLLAKIDEDELAVRRYEIEPGGTVPCSADSKQAYAVTTMRAALEGVARIDAELIAPDGTVLDRAEDTPFDPSLGAVVIAEPGDSVRAWPTMVLTIRLLAQDAEGAERELGVYKLSHTAD